MKRNTWEFPFPTEVILVAAQEKYGFHNARRQYWSEQYEAMKEQYKASGFVVDDSFGGSNVSYREVHVEFNQSLQRKMSDAKLKLTEHEAKTTEYQAFIQALSASPVNMLPLHYDDVVYFGIGLAKPLVAEGETADVEEEEEASAV